MRRCGSLATSIASQLRGSTCSTSQITVASLTDAAACTCNAVIAEHAARVASSMHCSTSGNTHKAELWSLRHVRGYAKAAGKGKAGAPPAVAAADAGAGAGAADSLAPPEFRMRHVPRVNKGDPVSQLTDAQRALLQELSPSRGPLRSLRQVNWDLGPQGTLALFHEQLSEVVGSNVQMVPIMLSDHFQSAASLAALVKDMVEEGRGMSRVEHTMLAAIANMSDVPFEGIKIQLKGRMSGKGGKASKKVWVWGRTGRKAVDDPLDYAHEAVVTRAGYIGIKVWIKYKRSHMYPQQHRIAKPAANVLDLLAMPAITALPSRSSSAWWNRPVMWQPQQHQAWASFKPGYDPLTATWARQQQQLQQPAQQAPAALEGDSSSNRGVSD